MTQLLIELLRVAPLIWKKLIEGKKVGEINLRDVLSYDVAQELERKAALKRKRQELRNRR